MVYVLRIDWTLPHVEHDGLFIYQEMLHVSGIDNNDWSYWNTTDENCPFEIVFLKETSNTQEYLLREKW